MSESHETSDEKDKLPVYVASASLPATPSTTSGKFSIVGGRVQRTPMYYAMAPSAELQGGHILEVLDRPKANKVDYVQFVEANMEGTDMDVEESSLADIDAEAERANAEDLQLLREQLKQKEYREFAERMVKHGVLNDLQSFGTGARQYHTQSSGTPPRRLTKPSLPETTLRAGSTTQGPGYVRLRKEPETQQQLDQPDQSDGRVRSNLDNKRMRFRDVLVGDDYIEFDKEKRTNEISE